MARLTEYTKDQLLQSAILLIREQGIGALNARNLAKWANCSTAPLFRTFGSMEEMSHAVKIEMDKVYDEFMSSHIKEENILISQSIAYIEFARQEPNIFFALFMNHLHKGMNVHDIVNAEWNQKTIKSVTDTAGLSYDDAKQVFLKIWLYSHGIATQMIASDIDFPTKLVESLVEDAFIRFVERKE